MCSTSPVVWRMLLWVILQPIRHRQELSIVAFWRQSSITWWHYVPCCHYSSVPASTPSCIHCKYCNQTPQKKTLKRTFRLSSKPLELMCPGLRVLLRVFFHLDNCITSTWSSQWMLDSALKFALSTCKSVFFSTTTTPKTKYLSFRHLKMLPS